jgi:5-methylcytosine-specific restriction endonuclease McrA
MQKETQVDHIIPTGPLKDFSDLPGFVERLFCEADGLRILCDGCHQKKTNAEREARNTHKGHTQ